MTGMTREVGMGLLDRAAEVGLLTSLGDGRYLIHPAVPWFLGALFNAEDPELQGHAVRAFVKAMAVLAEYYNRQYFKGNREVIHVLNAEEPNLLHARSLAREHGLWAALADTMQGFFYLYDHKSRRADWARLVKEIVPDFVDPATDAPLPGRELQWSQITYYRFSVAQNERSWQEAERLQRKRLDWDRSRANAQDPVSIRSLANSLNAMGEVQCELLMPSCVEAFRECFDLSMSIGDPAGAATAAYHLSHVHTELDAVRDLDSAEAWCRKSLDLRSPNDTYGVSMCFQQLGRVTWARFEEGRPNGEPDVQLVRYIMTALHWYHESLRLTPPDAIRDRAIIHNQWGNINRFQDTNRAMYHYRESIRLKEAGGDLYAATVTRYNLALALAQAGRRTDAREYAETALRGYQTFGPAAAADVQKTLELISHLAQSGS
jgi:tetratricopeptide (TPR) repeat protein